MIRAIFKHQDKTKTLQAHYVKAEHPQNCALNRNSNYQDAIKNKQASQNNRK